MKIQIEQSCSVEGKVAVVTGASENLGKAIILGLARSKVITYGTGFFLNMPYESANNQTYVHCDVEDPMAFKYLCMNLSARHNNVDILINAVEIDTASISIDANKSNKPNLQQIIERKLTIAYSVSKIAAEIMKNSGIGSIINAIAIRNAIGFPHDFSYIATKNALLISTRKLAIDLIKDNIRVNNIVLGCLPEEPNHDSSKSDCYHNLFDSIMFLVSPDSGSITGQDIFILGNSPTERKPCRTLSTYH
ncbi:MAG: SDR family oxidoreductase [Cyanobacteria bacterium P01_G01_bin.19]